MYPLSAEASSAPKHAAECGTDLADRLEAMLYAGRFREVVEDCARRLRTGARCARLHLRLGIALAALRQVDQATPHLAIACNAARQEPTLLSQAGGLLTQLGRLEQAREVHAAALRADPTCAPALKGLGAVHLRRGEADTAKQALVAACAHAPEDAEAAGLLGLALEAGGDAVAARAAAERAVGLNPSWNAALDAAQVLDATGAIAQSAQVLETRIAATARCSHSLSLLLRGLLQAPDLFEEADSLRAQAEAQGLRNGCPRLFVYCVIGQLLAGRRDRAAAMIDGQAKTAWRGRLDAHRKGDPVGAQFAGAFFAFLRGWLAAVERNETSGPAAPRWNPASAARPLRHIGESHALSFAHHTALLNGEERRIAPHLIFGAKAHHFGQARPNAYKARLAKHLADAPSGDEVLLSFGEIDCRDTEGVLPYHRKSGAPLDEIIERTVGGYVAFVQSEAAPRALAVACLGVPAPAFERNVSQADRAARIEVIRRFNAALKAKAQQAGLRFVDQYAFTAGPDGATHLRHHCDKNHLGPSALPEVIKQL